MPDLDAARNAEFAVAARGRVARYHISQVDGFGLGQVASEVDTLVVEACLVGTTAEIGQLRNGVVEENGKRHIDGSQ